MTDSPSAIDDRADLSPGALDDADDQDAGGRTYVTAFSRGLRIISCFSSARPSLTIAEVAKAAGLNRATARRLLLTLEADGYASQRDGRYSLTPRVLDLGYSYLSSLPLDALLYPSLFAVADRFRESCSAGMLDGHDVVSGRPRPDVPPAGDDPGEPGRQPQARLPDRAGRGPALRPAR